MHHEGRLKLELDLSLSLSLSFSLSFSLVLSLSLSLSHFVCVCVDSTGCRKGPKKGAWIELRLLDPIVCFGTAFNLRCFIAGAALLQIAEVHKEINTQVIDNVSTVPFNCTQ